MKLSFLVVNGVLTETEMAGLNSVTNGPVIHYTQKQRAPEISGDLKQFAIENNGLTIRNSSTGLEIYTDLFRTIPLFIYIFEPNRVLITSEIEDIILRDDFSPVIDKAGFWETILFENAFGSRTLFEGVMQVPSASRLTLDRRSGKITIARYWHFNISVNSELKDINTAIDGLDGCLEAIYSDLLSPTMSYRMGLSGGLDSRVSIAYLQNKIAKDRLSLFTYGFDPGILEYKYACEVADAAGFSQPEFHRLSGESYTRSLDDLVVQSGGQVGVQHSHIYDYLRELENPGILISNNVSDAVFGFDTDSSMQTKTLEASSKYKAIVAADWIPAATRQVMLDDLRQVFKSLDPQSNFSSADEFFYVTERNAKFHTYTNYLYGRFAPGLLPFADYRLLNYMISVPIEVRARKALVNKLLARKFPHLSQGSIRQVSSSQFHPKAGGSAWGEHLQNRVGLLNFRSLNRVNYLLRRIGLGRVQFFNKYQTEQLEREFYSLFKKKMPNAIEALRQFLVFSDRETAYLNSHAYRIVGITRKFEILTVSGVIKKIKS